MVNHATEWLGAYYDGELQGARLRQVEQHLVECAACQAELDGMRALSSLLQEPASNPDYQRTERFAANLALRLPRQSEQPRARRALKVGWWLIPVGLLAIWLFIDITLLLSSVISLAANSGLFGENLAWLQAGTPQMSWFTTAMRLFGDPMGAPGREVLAVLNDANLFIAQIAGIWIPQLVVAVFYCGWLLAWWLRNQHQPSKGVGSFPQS
jgi:anti-sigma factor RsiW